MSNLNLSKDIYNKLMIDKSIVAFSELASIAVFENEKYYICLFTNCRYDIKKTKKEFENYLIDLTNTCSIL